MLCFMCVIKKSVDVSEEHGMLFSFSSKSGLVFQDSQLAVNTRVCMPNGNDLHDWCNGSVLIVQFSVIKIKRINIIFCNTRRC